MTEHDRDPRIHPYIFKSIDLPFHTEDKPFGITQAEWELQKDAYFATCYQGKVPRWLDTPEPIDPVEFPKTPMNIGTVSLFEEDTEATCKCGLQAVYYMRNKAYCQGCWANGDDEDA